MPHRYEEDEERRERFYYTMLGGGGTPPASACPDVARLVVQQHFNCPSAWCILPLQVRLRLYRHATSRCQKMRSIQDYMDSLWAGQTVCLQQFRPADACSAELPSRLRALPTQQSLAVTGWCGLSIHCSNATLPVLWNLLFLPQDIFALMPRYSQRPAKEEVINDPTVTKHYWRYRCACCALLCSAVLF